MKKHFFACVLAVLIVISAVPAIAVENAEIPEAVHLDETGAVKQSFATLEEALASENATAGTIVRLEQDVELEQNLTVPAGVTLLLPCIDEDTGYQTYPIRILEGGTEGKIEFNHHGKGVDGLKGFGPNANVYRKLIIPEEYTMTVKGTVLVNSVSGREGTAFHEQDVTGGYAEIELEGMIVVERGGVLENFGYVTGSGQMHAKLGATVGDLFVVRNWRGGSQGMRLYPQHIYPMNESDCNNIQCELRIDYGAVLNGLVKLYADGDYHSTRFPQVAAANSMLQLSRGAYAVRTIEDDREVYHIYGGASFSGCDLSIVGEDVSSKDFLYPIDGDMDYTLHDGEYSFENDYKAMPGATILVEDDANLTIEPGVTVVFYDEFDDSAFNETGTAYPLRDAAILTLEEQAELVNEGIFAGMVYTNTKNIVYEGNSGKSAWSASTKEANGMNGRPSYNTLSFDFTVISSNYICEVGTNNELIWTPGQAGEMTVLAEATAEDGTAVTVHLSNLTETDESRIVMVAAYDGTDKMLAADISDVCLAEAGEYITVNLELNTSEPIDEIKLFVLDPQTKQPVETVQEVPFNE